MDKLVGKLMSELDRLKLREKRWSSSSATTERPPTAPPASPSTARKSPDNKATMLEGGSRVPMIVSWPGMTPAGKVTRDLVDFSDYFVTFADLAGAKLPAGVTLDGRSIAPQLKGESGTPRDWVYVELNGKHYVRTQRWKLTESNALYRHEKRAVRGDSSSPPIRRIPTRRPRAKSSRQRSRKLGADERHDARSDLPHQPRRPPCPADRQSRSNLNNIR
jgi:arylsulfatase A-like enzyme